MYSYANGALMLLELIFTTLQMAGCLIENNTSHLINSQLFCM